MGQRVYFIFSRPKYELPEKYIYIYVIPIEAPCMPKITYKFYLETERVDRETTNLR